MLSSIFPRSLRVCSKSTISRPLSVAQFPGAKDVPIISEPKFTFPEENAKIPCFQIMKEDGTVYEKAKMPNIGEDQAVSMYSHMVRQQTMDSIFYDAQRQGRISFYMTAYGEEAIHIGSSAALHPKDMVLAQYREQGVLMWRGFTIQQFADQCFSNEMDPGKGRQMPVHYGSNDLHYQTISSPLGTQIPQASGVGYGFKMSKEDRIAVCYFGEGAASEGDFHAGMNFAATTNSPVLFFCRNNGFAISTPVQDQYRGDGIASRATGYGMPTIRVDGNDIWAVYEATREARALVRKEQRPVLIEAMTYRQGHHSTSDDSTQYRAIKEIKKWKKESDPVDRMRLFLEKKNWWSDKQEKMLRDDARSEVLKALVKAESRPKPPLSSMFDDVYHDKPEHLKEQEQSMLDHIAKYESHYSSSDH